MALSGNKGEWSELYVFAKLLSEGRLYSSDINLNKIEESYYEIKRFYREEVGVTLKYNRNEQVEIYRICNDIEEQLAVLPINTFREAAKKLYEGILNAKGKSFNIPTVNSFIEAAKIGKLTALVSGKSDIKLRIYDHRVASEADLGFSIKSLLGKDSTLFNTGKGNNFIYRVVSENILRIDEFNSLTYSPPSNESKITYRINQLLDHYDSKFVFDSIQSKQLWLNLKMIDGDLPEILAHALFFRWKYSTSDMKEVVRLLEENDPMGLYVGSDTNQKMYEYKIKKFLAECAMGMTSETPWHGVYDATGGVIICKKDGDVLCFHIYDFNLFREYLLNNTKFEQPSTGEDEHFPGHERTTAGTKKYYYGWLYDFLGSNFFKINLQVRFK